MKNFFITSISALILTALFVMPSMAQDHADHHQNAEATEQFSDVTEDFRAAFTDVAEAYITGKDELFESDLKSATAAFETFKEKLEEIGKHGLSGDGHMAWMESYAELMEYATSLTASSIIEEARSAFRHLSDELITAVNKFGIVGVVYQQYCPMALDSDGANWLSQNEQVQNPYTPDTMPGCGQVIERIES